MCPSSGTGGDAPAACVPQHPPNCPICCACRDACTEVCSVRPLHPKNVLALPRQSGLNTLYFYLVCCAVLTAAAGLVVGQGETCCATGVTVLGAEHKQAALAQIRFSSAAVVLH